MRSNGNGHSVRTLEHEAEQTRAQLAASLDELRHSMSPGQIVDQVLDYAQNSGGGEFLHNLSRQVRENPLPVALVGAGLAWLMLAKGNAGRRYSASTGRYPQRSSTRGVMAGMTDTMHDAKESMAGAKSSVAGAANRVGEAFSGMADKASETMSDARARYHDARDSAAAMGSRMAQGASTAAGAAWHAGERAVETTGSIGHGMGNLFKDQPLLMGALGVAIGAAVGSALPRTEIEDEYLGPTSDAVMQEAKEFASEQYESVKEAAKQTLQTAKEEAEAQGLTGEGGAGEALSDIARKAGKVAESTVAAASENTKSLGDSMGAKKGEREPA